MTGTLENTFRLTHFRKLYFYAKLIQKKICTKKIFISVAGHEASTISTPVSLYCASKYAITGMTMSVRNELASLKTGIKITVRNYLKNV